MKSSTISRAVKFALVVGASSAALTAPAVWAEEEVERIEVTGSKIKRTDMETASPVTVFGAAEIEASGLTSVEDFVQNIPAINGGSLGSTVNNGNRGFATAALRGLGSGRTLVLINGRRFNSGDLNSIPISFIERIEVLRDGASTVYGSDAIAGVINFITKTNFEGTEVSAQYDVTGESDGEIYKFNITTGTSNDKGNVVFSVDYMDREGIMQGDRDYSSCPLTESNGEIICGGSGTSYPGHAWGVAEDTAFPASGGYVVDGGTPREFEVGRDAYNYAASSLMVTPQTIFSINTAARYEIADTDISSVSVFTEGGYSNRTSEQLMAPVGTFWSPIVPESNPGNVFGEDMYVARRLAETGGRNFTQDASDYRVVAGFDGTFANDWTWEVSYLYSRFVDSRIVEGQINQPRIETLLDPDKCAADAECAEAVAASGVTAWDPFTRDSLTQEMQDYALVTHSPVVRGTTKSFQVNFAGDLGGLELPGGAIQWAAGYENRTEEYQSQPDGAAALGQIYFVSGEKTEGQYRVEEFFTEFNFPLLADLPLVERLNLIAAVRYSDYDFLDSETNAKYGIEYAPIDGLLVRGTWAEGFRAPSITELFAPQSLSAQQYNEPCLNYGQSTNATLVANCQSENLPPDFNPASSQATSVFGGNPDLKPETSESLTFGLVWNPEFIEGFSMSLDYFDIEIEDGIGTAGTNNVITGCYESENFSSPLCDLIPGPELVGDSPNPNSPRRDAVGNVSGVLLTNANLSSFETSGLDFDFTYNMDLDAGDLRLAVYGTYLDKYDYTPFAGGETVSAAGKVAEDQWEGNPAVFSEWRTNFDIGYTADTWAVAWTSRYQSEGEDINAKESNLDNTADSIWYHDVQGSYFYDAYTFTLGVRNLFDEKPPYLTNYDDMNTVNQSYDLAGQYWYARISAKF